MRQVADDPGWQFKWPWLGPKGVRWWVTWTVDEWAVAFFCWLFTTLLLLFVIPAGAVAAGITYAVARIISRSLNPESPRRYFWVFATLTGLLLFLLAPSVRTWIMPLWPPFAALFGIGSPFLVIRLAGHFIGWNRPAAYWARLPRIVAAGPRSGVSRRIDPSALALPLMAGLEPTRIDAPLKNGKSPATAQAAVILPPLTVQKAIAGKPVRRRWIGRHENGFYIGNTRYDILWRL